MQMTWIRGARLVDPAAGTDTTGDLVVEGERIVAAGAVTPPRGAREVCAEGFVLCPGLVDLHVHLREPGKEEAETVATGLAAALAGGFAGVAAMPNTTPAMDTPEAVRGLLDRAAAVGTVTVYPVAAVTKGRAGKKLCDLDALAAAGAAAFSDDGDWVAEDGLMAEALEAGRRLGRPVLSHAEDPARSGPGRDLPEAEIAAVARDVGLARKTGAPVHVCHVSTAAAVQEVRRARADGLPVTCEVAPHHIALTEDDINGDTDCKMNPPLRSAADRQAMLDALRDGTIDVIATDHAPHTPASKAQDYAAAPNGVVGLETCVGVVATELVAAGVLDWPEVVRRLATTPAALLGAAPGSLRPGAEATLTLIDPACEWTVDPARFRSRSRNSPFKGRRLRGRVVLTMIRGRGYGDDGGHS
jgi:dihydroorotase